MQRKLFWKLALTFLALLLSVLLAVDFLAERALRRSYENDSYSELRAVAHALLSHPLDIRSLPPQSPEETATLNRWVSSAAATGVRVTVIAAGGNVVADLNAAIAKSVHEHWKLLLIEGIVLLVLGAAAVAFPAVAGLAATIS